MKRTLLFVLALIVVGCSDAEQSETPSEGSEEVANANWFGQPVNVAGAIARVGGDMHEHLGQSIAYARVNQIVPPWGQ